MYVQLEPFVVFKVPIWHLEFRADGRWPNGDSPNVSYKKDEQQEKEQKDRILNLDYQNQDNYTNYGG